MAENVDNMVVEQLRALRSELAEMRSEMNAGFGKVEERLETLEAGQQGLTGIVVSLGAYVHSLDNRIEHLEEKMGA